MNSYFLKYAGIALLAYHVGAHRLHGQVQHQPLTDINSPEIEYAPSVSANGQTLIFQSNREGRYKLYISHKNAAGKWDSPAPIEAINNFGNESDLIGGPSISYDGNFIYFFATFEGGVGQEDLWVSERKGSEWSSPVNLGAVVNSKGYDGFPSISSDGKSLYFMRLTETIVNKYNCYTLMVSEKDETGRWGRPRALPKPVNSNCEKCPRIMPDNETLLFASIREGSIKGSFDMYQTKYLGNNRWSEAKPLEFLNTEGNEYFGSVSAEGDILYFNAKGQNNEDILFTTIPVSLRPKRVIAVEGRTVEEKTGAPVGARIRVSAGRKVIADLPSNPADGSFTVVLPEGEYMIELSRTGYKTARRKLQVTPASAELLVKLAILETNLLLSTKNSLTNAPVQSQVSVKIPGDSKLTPEVNEKVGTIEITPIVYGYRYEVAVAATGYEPQLLQVELKPEDSLTLSREILLVPEKPRLVLTIVDEETLQPVNAQVRVMDLKRKAYLQNGPLADTFRTNLDFNGSYRIIAKADNYLFNQESINLADGNTGPLVEIALPLSLIKKGAKLQLKEIFFETNSADVTEESYAELKEVFDFLKAHRELIIEISAHTDDVGSHDSNMDLSDRRARAVVDFLVKRGVPAGMMVARGYGETKPVLPNVSDENRAKNRRVEFLILDKK